MLKRSNGVVMMMVAMAAVVTLLTSGIAFAITPEDPNVVPDEDLVEDPIEDPIEDPVVNPDDEDEGIVNNVFAANIIEAYPELNLTEADIQALREAGLGWGDVSIACGIAVNTGESLDNIIALAGEGIEWGEIAESLGMEDRAFGQYVKGVIGKGHAYGKYKTKENNGNNGNKDKDKDKVKPSNSGKPAHAGKPGQGAKD